MRWRGTPIGAALTMALTAPGAPVANAGERVASCRVRNVTQGSSGSSLKAVARRAVDGDRLRVRGTCPGEVVIRADITIVGIDGAILTGRRQDRVVRVIKGATVILRDLTIARGAADQTPFRGLNHVGGGILNHGDLTLIDATVRRNESLTSGGGIFNLGRMVLRRTTVSGNATTDRQFDPYGGGGIYSGGTLTLIGSTVSGNRAADYGGGIYGSGTLIDSVVSGNTATAGGGIAGGGTLVRSVVSDNTAAVGGGISISYGGSLTLTDSVVRGNTANAGGGISNDGTLDVAGTVVRGNTARDGGGIYNAGGDINNVGDLTLTDSVVRDNTAKRRGGGIANYYGGDLTLEGSRVTTNTAGKRGGGIWNDDEYDGTVTLRRGSSVTGNAPDDCYGTTAC